MTAPSTLFLSISAIFITATLSMLSAAPFISGTNPQQRPAAAPQLNSYSPSAATTAAQHYGIEGGLPATIQAFLEDQGAWYTPFRHHGMTGPYDLRGFHNAAAE